MNYFNNVIAFDKDDTLNYLTLEICKLAGITNPMDVPSLDQIKAKEAPEAFYEARTKFFSDPSVFETAPYGGARKMIDMAKEAGFKPKICTKTMTQHPQAPEITMHKMRFWMEHFNDIEMHIVTGEKTIDALALVDDSANNCFAFNKRNHRHFLIWSHKYEEAVFTEVLKSFFLVNNQLLETQTELLNTKDEVMYQSNLYFDFTGDTITIEESASKLDHDDYTEFSKQYDHDITLNTIYYKGSYDGHINDIVETVDRAIEKMEYSVSRDLCLISVYNMINALKV